MDSGKVIPISPVTVWTSAGLKTATKFFVSVITYESNGTASAGCSLLADDLSVIQSAGVSATVEQTSAWSDDVAFSRVLAQNAGLTPL